MIIHIKDKESGKNFRIPIPRFLISIGAFVLPLSIASNNLSITVNGKKQKLKNLDRQQIKTIKEAVRYLNKNYKGLVLVDIESKTGDSVKIVI